MYLSEIAPLILRGTLGVFCSMGVTGGVVVAQIISLHQILGNEHLWHICLSFQMVFLILFTIPYYIFPESPKYLYLIGDENGALRELRKLCDDIGVAQEELSTMESSCENRNNDRNGSSGILSVLRDPKLLLPLLLVCAMQGKFISHFNIQLINY
jgi:MFS transporter, SP family, solute carrier family 2 (facilitated glucose transporter), member 3